MFFAVVSRTGFPEVGKDAIEDCTEELVCKGLIPGSPLVEAAAVCPFSWGPFLGFLSLGLREQSGLVARDHSVAYISLCGIREIYVGGRGVGCQGCGAILAGSSWWCRPQKKGCELLQSVLFFPLPGHDDRRLSGGWGGK